MIVRVIVLTIALFLLSAPAPEPPIILLPAVVMVRAQPLCTFQNATTRLREVIYDSRNYPYGEVAAWSCGDPQIAIDEFNHRKDAMIADAAAFVAQIERKP